MRVAIMGSGALGGYFGARLALGGADVTFLARGEHLAAMRREGLRIVGDQGELYLPDLVATDDPAEVGPVDLAIVSVKLWASEHALEDLRPAIDEATTLVSLQNGVLKDSMLRARYPESHLIGGVAYIAATLASPGVIRRTGPLERLVVGEFDGSQSAFVESFHEVAVSGGINAEISADVRLATWEKFVFLVGLSATTATARTTIGPIRENRQSRELLLEIMREVVEVGRAHGVSLPPDYAEQRLAFTDTVSAEMTSSMHHDLELGRPLEAPWLSGGVVALGREVGVATPLNLAVAGILAVHADGGRA